MALTVHNWSGLGQISAAALRARRRWVLLSNRTPKIRFLEKFRVERQNDRVGSPLVRYFERTAISLFSDFRSSVKLRPWPRSRHGAGVAWVHLECA
jgi:hypothetical protein